MISISILIFTLLSLVFFSSASTMVGILSLLLSLALSTENARAKILKEVGVMVLTLVIIFFTSTLLSTSLGGIASMLANYQVGMRWGTVAGLVSVWVMGRLL